MRVALWAQWAKPLYPCAQGVDLKTETRNTCEGRVAPGKGGGDGHTFLDGPRLLADASLLCAQALEKGPQAAGGDPAPGGEYGPNILKDRTLQVSILSHDCLKGEVTASQLPAPSSRLGRVSLERTATSSRPAHRSYQEDF